MPLYEYQCDACGHRFEVIQKYSDAPIDTCPKCQGAVHKLFSSPAIQFKGSGWYITDYARAGKSDSGSDSGAKAEGSGTPESKSESTSDTKTSDTKPDAKSAQSDSKGESKPAAPSTSS